MREAEIYLVYLLYLFRNGCKFSTKQLKFN